jgi:hypothetical protein
MISSATPPQSVLFDVLLIIHVLVAVLSAITAGALYGAAASLDRCSEDEPWPSKSKRFFTPGPEIAGRSLYGIPLTGVLLVLVSQDHYSLATGFVGVGIALWLGAVALAELFVFRPAAKIRTLIARQEMAVSVAVLRPLTVRMRWGVDGVILLLIAGAIVMVAQP